MQSNPVLSVVVTIASDTIQRPTIVHLRATLSSLFRQVEDPPAVEVIVPHYPGFPGIAELQREFLHVRFLEAACLRRYTGRSGTREHHNELRARGIIAARGEVIALTEDHAIVGPHWCARIVEAHAQPVAAVGGAIENAAPGLISWAVYFRDFAAFQNPLREDEALSPSDVNASYKRAALESIGCVWNDTFEEQAVNRALRDSGQRIIFSPRIVVYQNRVDLDLGTALKERWIWGKSYGDVRSLTGARRLAWAAVSPALPFVIIARLITVMAHKKRNIGVFCRAFPLLVLMTIAWCCGEMAAYVTGPKNTPSSGCGRSGSS